MRSLTATFLFLSISGGLAAQKAGELKTFKDRKAKLSAANLYNLSVNADNGEIQVISFNKKGNGEQLTFASGLVLKEKKEISFDFDADRDKNVKEQYGSGVRVEYGKNGYPYLVLKDSVLYIGTQFMGIRMSAEANKLGMAGGNGANMFIERGKVVQYTGSYNYGSYGSGTQTNTEFVPDEKVKLKSDEDKNMSYEYSKTNGDEFIFRNTSEVNMTTYTKSGESRSLVYSGMYANYYRVYDTYSSHSKTAVKGGAITKRLISGATGDVLLVGKRRMIVKFAQKPSPEDMHPYYYVFQIDARTLDIKAQNKFQEPYSSAIIFRHTLSVGGGILLVSAPTKMAGDKASTFAENKKRYTFRQVGDDTKLNWSLDHDMPSGFTQFLNVIEMADSSLILYAIADSDKQDSYFNKKIGRSGDLFYTLKIKNGKVLGSNTFTMDHYYANYKTPAGVKPTKEPFNIAEQELNIAQIRYLDNGGAILIGTITKTDPASKAVSMQGNALLHFSAEGKLENQFWVPSTSEVKPALDPLTFQTGENEFLWLTFNSKDANGAFLAPSFTRVNLQARSISAPLLVGDKEHVVTTKNPMVYNLDTRTMSFFGFDKDGEEFWTQNVVLE